MEGKQDDVVALADRLARRSQSRLTGEDHDEVTGEVEEEEDVERLRMASPFCQGREDSYFSPQDVEIVKEVDDKVRTIPGVSNLASKLFGGLCKIISHTRIMVWMGHPI